MPWLTSRNVGAAQRHQTNQVTKSRG